MLFSLTDASQAPVIAQIGNRTFHIPKMELEEVVTWSNKLQKETATTQEKGLSGIQLKEFRQLYPSLPPTVDELRRMLRTAPGIKYVLGLQLLKAKVFDAEGNELPSLTKEEAAAICKGPTGPRMHLARLVADFETSMTEVEQKTAAEKEQEEKENDPDPLAGGEEPASGS